MKKFFKLFGWSVLIALIVIQFFPPDKNENPAYSGHRLTDTYKVSDEVNDLLEVACYDCHSNNTRSMFYMNIQPVSYWIMHHVNEGKEELNFDEFGTYPLAKQYHKLEEISEMVEEEEMPLSSYTIIHEDASLSKTQREVLIGWADALRDTLEAHYPMDSLVSRK
jgi:hypothetical protein